MLSDGSLCFYCFVLFLGKKVGDLKDLLHSNWNQQKIDYWTWDKPVELFLELYIGLEAWKKMIHVYSLSKYQQNATLFQVQYGT